MKVLITFLLTTYLLLFSCAKKDEPIAKIATSDLIGNWKIKSIVVNGLETFNVPIQTYADTITTNCSTTLNYENTCTFFDGMIQFNENHTYTFNGHEQQQVLNYSETYNSCQVSYNQLGVSDILLGTSTWRLNNLQDYSQISLTTPTNPVGGLTTEVFKVLEFTPNELMLSGNNMFSNCNGSEYEIITLEK